MHSTKYFPPIFLLSITGILLWVFILREPGQDQTPPDYKNDLQNGELIEAELSTTGNPERPDASLKNDPINVDEAFKAIQPHEMILLEDGKIKWAKSRGYFDEEDFSLYASYDDETLWQLAGGGDLLALTLWADSLKEQGRKEDALQTEMTAAIYGSTAALTRLATFHQVSSWQEDLPRSKKLSHIKTMLMYAEVAAKRGDRNGIASGLLELQRRGIKLSKDDLTQISDAADNLFSELEQQREQLGLASFDNAADPLMDIQMNYIISAVPNPGGWATQYMTEIPEIIYANADDLSQ